MPSHRYTALAIRLRKYFNPLLLDGLTNWLTSTALFTQLQDADKRHVSRLPALQPSWNVRSVNGKCLLDKDDSAAEPLKLSPFTSACLSSSFQSLNSCIHLLSCRNGKNKKSKVQVHVICKVECVRESLCGLICKCGALKENTETYDQKLYQSYL